MSLEDRFKEAGLILKVLDKPISGLGDNALVFQMDIERRLSKNTRDEIFRIWKGHEDNRVEVLSIDKRIQQIVLLVHEAKREITVELPRNFNGHSREEFFRNNRIKEDTVFVENGREMHKIQTPGTKRHFLLGKDERQMFIAQLPRGLSSVKSAHDSLKSPTVTFAEGRARGRTIRQGEWFFVNISEEEKSEIIKGIKDGSIIVKKKEGIPGGNGKPHVAAELIVTGGPVLNPRLLHGFPIRSTGTFVRGTIAHPDHSVAKIREWRRAIRNTEGNDGRMDGIGWID